MLIIAAKLRLIMRIIIDYMYIENVPFFKHKLDMKTLQFISLLTLALLGCKDFSKPKYTPIVLLFKYMT